MITSFDKAKKELDTASMYFNTQYVFDYGNYQTLFSYTPDFKNQGLVYIMNKFINLQCVQIIYEHSMIKILCHRLRIEEQTKICEDILRHPNI